MAYIGPKPSQTLATPTSQYFNGTGSQTVFTLNRAVNVPEDLEVFVNNIQQEPGVGKSYTATGTTLTFDVAPSSGTANVYVVYRGLAEVTTRLEHDPNAALAATTGTFSGNVDVTGVITTDGMTTSADINFGDNDKAIFGAGSDLQIYHDASNSYIQDTGTGNLYVKATNLVLEANDGTNYLVGLDNLATRLHHPDATNDVKLATTATGVLVTGTVTADGLTVDTNTLHVDAANNRVGIGTASPSRPLHLQSSSGGGMLSVEKTSATTSAFVVAADSGAVNLFARDTNSGSGNVPLGFNIGSTRAMTIDSSGNVGIGTSSPSAKLNVHGSAIGDVPLAITHAWGSSSTPLITASNGSNEVMRLERSGNVALNGSVRDSSRFTINGNVSNPNLQSWQNTTSGVTHFWFRNPNGIVGSVVTSGSSTAYNTSSDYRLKENVVTDWDATTRLKQLNPVRFNFIANPDTTVDGFLAHEVQDIVPEAISGTHNEVDDDGNPVYQGIDQSKLVPLLVKTIQELEARIAALETA